MSVQATALDLIGRIYAAVLDPPEWQAFVEQLSAAYDDAAVAFALQVPGVPSAGGAIYAVGFQPEYRAKFAEHVVLNARRMWSEFPLKHRRRMQKVLFPEGLAWDGEAFRTPVTCLFFRDLERSESEEYELVARTGFEPACSRRRLETEC